MQLFTSHAQRTTLQTSSEINLILSYTSCKHAFGKYDRVYAHHLHNQTAGVCQSANFVIT